MGIEKPWRGLRSGELAAMLKRGGKFTHARGEGAGKGLSHVAGTPAGCVSRVFPLHGNGWDGVENPGKFLDNPAGGSPGMQGGKTGAANARKMAERSQEGVNAQKRAKNSAKGAGMEGPVKLNFQPKSGGNFWGKI